MFLQQQQRWRYYRVFVKGRKKAWAGFVGRYLDAQFPDPDQGSAHFTEFCSLYEDQDGYLYLVLCAYLRPYVQVRYPDYERIDCWSCLGAKTREELIDRLREFGKANGVENPVIPEFLKPVPAIEDMHTMTGWDV